MPFLCQSPKRLRCRAKRFLPSQEWKYGDRNGNMVQEWKYGGMEVFCGNGNIFFGGDKNPLN